MPGANRLTLDATIAQREDLRYTPAGIPAHRLTLSARVRAGRSGRERERSSASSRRWRSRDVAESLARLPVGNGAALRGIPRAALPHRHRRSRCTSIDTNRI